MILTLTKEEIEKIVRNHIENTYGKLPENVSNVKFNLKKSFWSGLVLESVDVSVKE